MAYGSANVQSFGTGVSDIFSGFGDIEKMKADELEAGQYEQAAQFALQNEQFTKDSTALKEAQINREVLGAQGRTTAEIASAGFQTGSGSALDLLRSGAQQGALTKAVASQQGLITEAGYQEQAQSYQTMAQVASEAAKGANLASIGSFVSAAFSFGAAAIPS